MESLTHLGTLRMGTPRICRPHPIFRPSLLYAQVPERRCGKHIGFGVEQTFRSDPLMSLPNPGPRSVYMVSPRSGSLLCMSDARDGASHVPACLPSAPRKQVRPPPGFESLWGTGQENGCSVLPTPGPS